MSSSNNLDPELANYFLIDQRPSVSTSASPKYGSKRRSKDSKAKKSAESIDSHRSQKHRSKNDTSASSVTSKSRAITDWSEKNILAITSSTSWDSEMRHPADPPRPPKSGFEWVWFPEGYWAERPLPGLSSPKREQAVVVKQRWWNISPRRSSSSPKRESRGSGKTLESKESTTPPATEGSKADVPRIHIGSAKAASIHEATLTGSRRSSHISTLSATLSSFSFLKSNNENDSQVPQEGLYCRAKRNIRERILERPAKLVCQSNIR